MPPTVEVGRQFQVGIRTDIRFGYHPRCWSDGVEEVEQSDGVEEVEQNDYRNRNS
jgi:hypothetical protein